MRRETMLLNSAPAEAAEAAMLNEIAVEAGKVPNWIMLARVGRWAHPSGVDEDVTREHLAAAYENLKANAEKRGADLVIDYHHGSVMATKTGQKAPAAGWVTDVDLRAGGTELWGQALWTSGAANAISAREFRYVSPVLLFDATDPSTRSRVPMRIHSVALTNTPVMRELAGLNHDAPGTEAGGSHHPPAGGSSMKSLLEMFAIALGLGAADAASKLGVNAECADKDLAEKAVANAARVPELEQQLQAKPALPETLCNALGVKPDTPEAEVRGAIIKLKAPASGMSAVCNALSLDDGAGEAEALAAIKALKEQRSADDAEALCNAAVAEGKVAPAQKDWLLKQAQADLDGTRAYVNSLQPIVGQAGDRPADKPTGTLTDEERQVCNSMDLSEEDYITFRDTGKLPKQTKD